MRSSAAPAVVLVALSLALAAVAGACAPASGPATGAASGSVASPATGAATPALAATGAWVRAAPVGGTSAAYFQLANDGSADAVVTGATSEVAEATSVHETSTDSGGMTGMHHVPALVVPAGTTVPFEPGGYHVMLERLTQDLAAGSTVTITLQLEGGGTLDVAAEVRAG